MDGNPIYVAPFLGLGVALKAPTADGSANQVIKTDGSGNLSFVTVASGITIDSTAITGGSANRFLIENASNQVSESSTLIADGKLDIGGTYAFVVNTGKWVAFKNSGGAEKGYIKAGTNNLHITSYGGGSSGLFLMADTTRDMVGVNQSHPTANIHILINTGTHVGQKIDLASGQSVNAFEVNSYGGSGGDLFVVDSAGAMKSPAIKTANTTEGGTANLARKTAHETHTLAAAGTSDTTTISIPSGCRLLGVSFCVNTAVSDDGGDDTWSAAFVTGSTTTLATAAAAAQNTKVNLMLPDEISTGVCQIRFTANGGSFDAGVIEIVAYYEELTSLANV